MYSIISTTERDNLTSFPISIFLILCHALFLKLVFLVQYCKGANIEILKPFQKLSDWCLVSTLSLTYKKDMVSHKHVQECHFIFDHTWY